VTLVGLALACALAPLPPAAIDRVYSRGVYATLQPVVTSISSLLPIALLDVLLALALLWLGVRARRVGRAEGTARKLALGRLAGDLLALVALAYVLFLAFWGLNYRRLPITAHLDYDPTRVTPASVLALGERAVTELNRLHDPAHAALAGTPTLASVRVRLAPAFADAQRALGATRLATPGRPKWSIVSPFFRWASVDGMVNPFGLEVLINPDVLPVERPFVVAHEWGHLAGWARESEASFLGWLTCLEGDDLARYSGWLDLYLHLRGDVPTEPRRRIDAALAAGPREDVAAIGRRLSAAQPLVQRLSWRTYDQFLKANHVDEGVRNYDEVVRLVVGTMRGLELRPTRLPSR
jgi:hypothetical protein